MSPAPNMAAEIGTIRISPRTVERIASKYAEMSAPTPTAPIRNPNVCGPPFKTWMANTGINTVKGQPIRLTTVNNRRMVRIGVEPETYFQPSFGVDETWRLPRGKAASASNAS